MIGKLIFYETIVLVGVLIYHLLFKYLASWNERSAWGWRKNKEAAEDELIYHTRIIIDNKCFEVFSVDESQGEIILKGGRRIKFGESVQIKYTCPYERIAILREIIEENKIKMDDWLFERFYI